MIGMRLKQARKKQNITMAAMADKIGVSPVTVSRWESGVNEPDDATKSRLAEILNTSVTYLMGYDNHHEESCPIAALLDILYKYKNYPFIENEKLQVALYIVRAIEKELVRRIEDATDHS